MGEKICETCYYYEYWAMGAGYCRYEPSQKDGWVDLKENCGNWAEAPSLMTIYGCDGNHGESEEEDD